LERFASTFTVRWSDCDANGHLRNTCYSEYTIETRMAFLATRGFGLAQFKEYGMGPVLLREEVDYLRECHMGEVLRVDLLMLGLSPDGARFKLGHQISKAGGKVAARLVVSGGWMDLAQRRLAPPPPVLKSIWDEAERAEPFEVLRPARVG
jgi:acyl-CoA thioester hydrolase